VSVSTENSNSDTQHDVLPQMTLMTQNWNVLSIFSFDDHADVSSLVRSISSKEMTFNLTSCYFLSPCFQRPLSVSSTVFVTGGTTLVRWCKGKEVSTWNFDTLYEMNILVRRNKKIYYYRQSALISLYMIDVYHFRQV
jgi:hypothetical protein